MTQLSDHSYETIRTTSPEDSTPLLDLYLVTYAHSVQLNRELAWASDPQALDFTDYWAAGDRLLAAVGAQPGDLHEQYAHRAESESPALVKSYLTRSTALASLAMAYEETQSAGSLARAARLAFDNFQVMMRYDEEPNFDRWMGLRSLLTGMARRLCVERGIALGENGELTPAAAAALADQTWIPFDGTLRAPMGSHSQGHSAVAMPNTAKELYVRAKVSSDAATGDYWLLNIRSSAEAVPTHTSS